MNRRPIEGGLNGASIDMYLLHYSRLMEMEEGRRGAKGLMMEMENDRSG